MIALVQMGRWTYPAPVAARSKRPVNLSITHIFPPFADAALRRLAASFNAFDPEADVLLTEIGRATNRAPRRQVEFDPMLRPK